MVVRIGPKQPHRLYLAEWREKAGLTQEQLGERLGTSDVTISRWETRRRQPDLNALAALCEALEGALGLDLQPMDLYRHPDTPSADALLRGQPPEVRDEAIKIIRAIRR